MLGIVLSIFMLCSFNSQTALWYLCIIYLIFGRGNWGLELNLFALNQPTETKLFSANTSYSYWGSERFFPVTSLDLSWNSMKHARGRSLVYGASVLLTHPCLAQMEHYVDRIISTEGVSTWHQDALQCQRVPGSSQPPTQRAPLANSPNLWEGDEAQGKLQKLIIYWGKSFNPHSFNTSNNKNPDFIYLKDIVDLVPDHHNKAYCNKASHRNFLVSQCI